ncbi:MAG: hypothetical protein IKQ13_00065 [Treponema sp.]|nr:hypothetical protein [Treponema sp.]
MKNRKNQIIYILFIITLFISCVPKSNYLELQAENEKLKQELELLKQTDEYYYKDAVDKFQNKEFEAALEELKELCLKFPQTSLQKDVDTLILEIQRMYQTENNNKNEVLVNAKKASSLDESISILTEYLEEKHPVEFINEVKSQLDIYNKKNEMYKTSENRIVDISPVNCDEECGDISTYKIISIDTFRALYAKQSNRWAKIGFENLKLTHYEENALRLVNNEHQWLYAVTFNDEVMEKMVGHKNAIVNIYGHVREDTRYGWGIIIDVIEIQ